jgi:DNA-binding transcriptional LysR family regulator
MEVLVRVVETGSFSGAPRQLRVGQPAVSMTIAQLEGRLGVSLLLRSSRGLTPRQARTFTSAPSVRSKRQTRRSSRRAARAPVYRLRFKAGVTGARLHIIPRLPLFLAAHPQLTVEAILNDHCVDLIAEGIDVAFQVGTLADSTMVARKIGQSRRLVLGTPPISRRRGSRRHRLNWRINRL